MNALDILKRFDTFLTKAENEEVKLASMKLANGAVLEADEFAEGKSVFIVSDDDRVPLPVGEYELEDGRIMVVGEVGKIGKIGLESIPEAEEEGYKDGIADAKEDIKEDIDKTKLRDDGKEAAVDDWAGMEKRIKNLEDAIADLKEDKVSVKNSEDDSPQDPDKYEGGYVSKQEFEDQINEIKEMVSKVEAKLNEGKEEDGAFVVKEELEETKLFKHNPNAEKKSNLKIKLGENRGHLSVMDKVMERISNIKN
jgi:hypothetical protein